MSSSTGIARIFYETSGLGLPDFRAFSRHHTGVFDSIGGDSADTVVTAQMV
jgi:hypothetical protein